MLDLAFHFFFFQQGKNIFFCQLPLILLLLCCRSSKVTVRKVPLVERYAHLYIVDATALQFALACSA